MTRKAVKHLVAKKAVIRSGGVAKAKPGRIAVQGFKGVVQTYLGSDFQKEQTAASILAPVNLVPRIIAGLPVQELQDLQASLSMPMEKLAPMLGISKATLHRRMADKLLGASESDRVVRFARLMSQAMAVFETAENARQWLSAPQVGLGGEIPLEYAQTEVGAREVENLLGRIEYGVYS